MLNSTTVTESTYYIKFESTFENVTSAVLQCTVGRSIIARFPSGAFSPPTYSHTSNVNNISVHLLYVTTLTFFLLSFFTFFGPVSPRCLLM